jgi:hypothetical protein
VRKLFGLLLGLVLICAASSLAQDKTQDKPKSKNRMVTGCLSKGDSPGEYKLTAKDGTTWELTTGGSEAMSNETATKKGGNVDLAEHVGHTVTVTGMVESAKTEMKEHERQEAKEGGTSKHEHGNEPRELKVTSVKHVSASCS